ncbi:MAG: radical SAM protein [Candidatus Edwardsbacteria bacterium]
MYCSLGYKCNNNCLTCPIDPKLRETAFVKEKQIRDFIEARGIGVGDKITFSGGEPTLYPKLISLTRWCAELLGSEVEILTNARCLANSHLAEALSEIHRVQITTAIYSSERELHDQITRRKASFDETISGITQALSYGIRVVLKTVISKLNYRLLPDIFAMLLQRFPQVDDFIVYGTDWTGNALRNISILFISNSEIAPFLEEAAFRVTDAGKTIQIRLFPLCLLDPALWPLAIDTYPNEAAGDCLFTPESEIVDFEIPAAHVQKQCECCLIQRFCGQTWDSYFDVFGSHELCHIHL